jgi:hypothetical protein
MLNYQRVTLIHRERQKNSGQVEASRLGTLAHLNGHAIWRNSDPHRLDLPGHGMAQISDMKYFCRKKNVEIML